MNNFKKILLVLILIFPINNSFAEAPYYIDFKFILNESDAGKKAQLELKKRLNDGVKSLSTREKNLQESERKILEQKKIISAEEYKKKVNELRNKVSKLQKDRNTLLEKTANQRANARKQLLENLNPILKKYMVEKKIRMIIDKKNLILADENLNITKDIIKLLNNKLKTIKLN